MKQITSKNLLCGNYTTVSCDYSAKETKQNPQQLLARESKFLSYVNNSYEKRELFLFSSFPFKIRQSCFFSFCQISLLKLLNRLRIEIISSINELFSNITTSSVAHMGVSATKTGRMFSTAFAQPFLVSLDFQGVGSISCAPYQPENVHMLSKLKMPTRLCWRLCKTSSSVSIMSKKIFFLLNRDCFAEM